MSLLRSTATVGGYTMISRVLGFMRDILIAAHLGSGPIADAFWVAFRFPNLFRRFFGEGAFNSAFVPLYARTLEADGRAAAQRFAEEALAGLFYLLLIFTILAQIFMPWFMYALAFGYADDPERWSLSILFTRITFPYLLCMSLVALLSGVLNSYGRFAAAAAAPIALNVVLILAITVLGPMMPTTGHALSWGVAGAGLAQLGLLFWACAREGLTFRLRRPRLTPGVKRLVTLGIPGLIAGGITQINIVVGTLIASQEDGAVSLLAYADRVYQLPLGIVGIAMGVVLLPDLSRRLRGGDDAGARRAMNRGLELAMLLTVPAAVALLVIPLEVVTVLFERGAFTAEDSAKSARALMAFAAGLPAFVLIKVFSPGFFAREDTHTPMRYAALSMVINVGGSLLLFPVMGFTGIALSTSLAGWANAGLLAWRLGRDDHFRLDERVRARLPRIFLAAFAMGIALAFVSAALSGALEGGLGPRVGMLAALVFTGLAAYGGVCLLAGATRPSDLRSALTRQGGSPAATGETGS